MAKKKNPQAAPEPVGEIEPEPDGRRTKAAEKKPIVLATPGERENNPRLQPTLPIRGRNPAFWCKAGEIPALQLIA